MISTSIIFVYAAYLLLSFYYLSTLLRLRSVSYHASRLQVVAF